MSARLTEHQWSQYWRRDSITTFSRRFNGNYDREFKDFWNARFAALSSGAAILDLGTGNGAIPLLALEYASERGLHFDVTGVDLAEIRPREVLAAHAELMPLLARISFLSGVPMDATGLPSHSVDLVTSQYGLEYGNPPSVLSEAWRLLRADGSLAVILHHAGSVVVKLAEDAIKQVQYCLHREQIDKRVEALVQAMGETRSEADRRRLRANPRTESLRKKINASIARINVRARRYQDPEGFIGVMLPNLMNVFARYRDRPVADKLRYVRRVREEFDGFQARMADLRAAALSEEQFEALEAEARKIGFAIRERGTLRYGESQDLMGWILVADKR